MCEKGSKDYRTVQGLPQRERGDVTICSNFEHGANMTGKTYPKDFERYWARAKKNSPGPEWSLAIKRMAFNAYRAGVRHTNGEHSRARARYYRKMHPRRW